MTGWRCAAAALPPASAKPGLWAALTVLLALVGCAAPPAAPPARELATASDQTDLERRARTRLELAGAYYSRGQFETALDEVKLSIQITPALPDAYNLRGLIYAAMREDQLADDNFQRALQLNPRDGSAMNNRAWFLCQRDRFDEAQAQFKAALALPQYRDTQRTLLASGVCHGRAQQWADAEQALMRAYELDPANPSAGLNLADVLYRRQAFERARFYIGRVNDKAETANAQTLWLAARIEHKLGRLAAERALGEQLRNRFPQAPETSLFDQGRFDE
jgi:type IV pilus assembly protein PilF